MSAVHIIRRSLAATVFSIGLTTALSAHAMDISDDVVRIGVLTDMSGPFSDWSGNGSVTAVQMAVADFGGKVAGKPIEVVSADHQNKTDVGLSIARQWYENGKVDAIFDISNSAVALAVMGLTKEKNKIVVLGGVSSPRVTEDACTPNSIQYIYDANALSNVIGKALVKQGGDTWYFITVDFAFGIGLEKTTTAVVQQQGGKVLGAVRHPLNTADFSSYLVKAQASGAKVIALADSGADGHRHGQDEVDSDQRLLRALPPYSRGRSGCSRHVSDAGEESERVETSLGLLQEDLDRTRETPSIKGE